MFVRNLRAPGGNARAWAIFTLALVGLAATPAGAAVVPVGVTMDQYELPPADGPGAFDAEPGAPASSDAAPVIVPLPPPLFSGLLGLGALAALRAGRRVYRRR